MQVQTKWDYSTKQAPDWQYSRRPFQDDHGWIMRSLVETAAMITGCGSAVCWFVSAMWHRSSIKPGIEESDKVTELSNRLQKISRWNFCAAGLMGVTALLSVWGRFLGFPH